MQVLHKEISCDHYPVITKTKVMLYLVAWYSLELIGFWSIAFFRNSTESHKPLLPCHDHHHFLLYFSTFIRDIFWFYLVYFCLPDYLVLVYHIIWLFQLKYLTVTVILIQWSGSCHLDAVSLNLILFFCLPDYISWYPNIWIVWGLIFEHTIWFHFCICCSFPIYFLETLY